MVSLLGIFAVAYDEYKVCVRINGTEYCYVQNTTEGTIDKGQSKQLPIAYAFQRWIEGLGDFTSTVNLSLSGSDGTYTYTYDGTVVDNFKTWTKNGSYNAFGHLYAPTMYIDTGYNGYNDAYSRYYHCTLNQIVIDRDGLYQAMRRDGITTTYLSACLEFDSVSTGNGKHYKTIKITCKTVQ